MKRFDMEIQPQRYYMGKGQSYTISPYKSTNGDWVKWDDAQELLEALKEIRDVTDARSRWSIACAAIAKFEGTKQ